jgi:hypothetical protein
MSIFGDLIIGGAPKGSRHQSTDPMEDIMGASMFGDLLMGEAPRRPSNHHASKSSVVNVDAKRTSLVNKRREQRVAHSQRVSEGRRSTSGNTHQNHQLERSVSSSNNSHRHRESSSEHRKDVERTSKHHHSSSSSKNDGKHVKKATFEKTVRRIYFCGNCYNTSTECCCSNPCAVKLYGVDGHPNCPIPYLITAVYGFNPDVSPTPQNWTLTVAGNFTYMLAPLAPATLADMQLQFGFTEEATRRGELVFIGGSVSLPGELGGMFMITRLPGSSNSNYLLRQVNFLDDECYKIREGAALRIRFGTSAWIYEFIDIDYCDGTVTIEQTNYTGFDLAQRVYAACDAPSKKSCNDDSDSDDC